MRGHFSLALVDRLAGGGGPFTPCGCRFFSGRYRNLNSGCKDMAAISLSYINQP